MSELSVVLLGPFKQIPVYCLCLAPIIFLYILSNFLFVSHFDIRR